VAKEVENLKQLIEKFDMNKHREKVMGKVRWGLDQLEFK
jgi:hypothetical protein